MSATTIVVVGPTAAGKTELSVALAREIGGEIISADSRQIYKRLDAGTAKPARDSQGRVEGVPYHLLDMLEPEEAFDAGRFARLAEGLERNIRDRGAIPILAGGTGLYVKAFLQGLAPMPGRDEALRRELAALASERGGRFLKEKLLRVDPEAARRIPDNNAQRLIRALEVYKLSGRPISSFWAMPASRKPTASFLIDWPLPALKARIARRAEAQWPGMLAEARELISRGYGGHEPGLQSLGYREALQAVKGEISSAHGLSELVQLTHAYAKRQRTWFRHQIQAQIIPGGPLERMLEDLLSAIHAQRGS
ncbi:MAG: tRNA (adenosine(37)-N6)-dimethylallyltransferase MiaA [Elusimicrobia bacterium]|nr:tRNA (adenosine(37)-N6)-dimethylallyltransferase MiaA [Elusimicrobiota bacterium]